MQQKFDGRRVIIRVENGKAEGANRKGLIISLPKEVEDTLCDAPNCVIDGELVGNRYYVFDALSFISYPIVLNPFASKPRESPPHPANKSRTNGKLSSVFGVSKSEI